MTDDGWFRAEIDRHARERDVPWEDLEPLDSKEADRG
jgi:hypothetical protein